MVKYLLKESSKDRVKALVVSSLHSFIFDEILGLSKKGVEIHVAKEVMSVMDGRRRNLAMRGVHLHNFHRKISPSLVSIGAKCISELPPTAFLHPRPIVSTVPRSWFVTKLVKMYQIDVIHAHWAVPEGFAGLIAKLETKKPLVVTLHGADILTERSIGYGVRLRFGFDAMLKKVLKNADVVIAASTATAKETLKVQPYLKKLVLIPNGVDLNRFNMNIDGRYIRDELGIGEESIVFTLRHHVPKNGIEYLIKAAYLAIRDNPHLVFIIGGNGPLRRRHERLARELGIARNVFFTGYIPPNEVPYYYAASNLFVIPSVIEAFGIATVEAMGCGKPVIGTNVGGIPDIIDNGINGYLVKPKDPKSLADKIAFLIGNPCLMKKMGKEGRRIAEENFDMEKRIDKVLTVYSELVE
jgi:glycosyltransferase involved in cell wall biosynthesis